jgi:hypothetical protein
MMGLEANEYESYAEFKRNVLTKVVKEVNGQTEYNVTFNEFRQKKKVYILEFIIENSAPQVSAIREKAKKKLKDLAVDNWLVPGEEDQIIEKLNKFGIGAMAGAKLIEEYGLGRIENVINRTISDKKDGEFGEQVNLAGVVINRIKDPDPQNISDQTTPQQLESRRTEMVAWLEENEISYQPYDFSGNWVGVSIKGTIVNFMNSAFQSEVGKIIGKTTAKSEV